MEKQAQVIKTPLYDRHVEAGAKMVDFAGYMLPLQYAGIIKEHEAVRTDAGLFDLTHMGELEIRGSQAEKLVQHIITNDVTSIPTGGVLYTLICDESGGILDDALVYKMKDRYMLVVNAINTQRIYRWILDMEVDFEDCLVVNKSDKYAIVAIQGPKSEEILQKITPCPLSEIEYYHFVRGRILDTEGIISRTGYTGEDGFELYIENKDAMPIWDALMVEGQDLGLVPVGLGARDTLRLEAKYPLYGNELNEVRNPFEVGLKWAVGMEKPDFCGKEPMLKYDNEKPGRKLIGFEVLKNAIPRKGCVILNENQEEVGTVTSGTFSPTLKKPIGLAFVRSKGMKVGKDIFVEIRKKKLPAKIIKTPFYKGSVKSGKKK